MDKKELKRDIKDNKTLSKELEKALKEEFEKVINDPSEKRIKVYKEAENALLVLWLRDVMSNLTESINEAVQNGKTTAIEQLRKKGFKKVVDNSEIYSELANSQKQLIKADLEKIIAGIKANSRRNILEMREAFILQKKKLTSGFMDTFKKYGIAYFTDRAGRRWTLERYIDMATTTTVASVNRQAYFAKSLEWGNDLVRVYHIGISPECPLCAPFTGKVLSISGNTRGYMSVNEASQSGHLFSYNCDHDVMALELAPEIKEGDNKIALTDKNVEYLKKHGFKNIKRKAYYEK
ncbi:MAG: phage minor capsid protein [Bacilli bacterium]|nr:phage minor capsid protein [Bacilli bacterium]